MKVLGVVVALVLWAFAGCSGGSDGSGDAALPDAATPDAEILADAELLIDAQPDALATPEPPPPTLTPCQPGWRVVMVAGVATCDPYPATGRLACPAGQAHFPGQAAC